MTGVPPSGSGCQPTASAADASSRGGIPNAALCTVCGAGKYASVAICDGVCAECVRDIPGDLRAWAAPYANPHASDETDLLLSAAKVIEIGTAAWSPRLAQPQAENGEAPVPNLPTYNELLRHYAALLDAVDYAHSEGFEWPADPFGPAALAFANVDAAVEQLASAMSAFGQDPQGLEAPPASAAREAGDAQ